MIREFHFIIIKNLPLQRSDVSKSHKILINQTCQKHLILFLSNKEVA